MAASASTNGTFLTIIRMRKEGVIGFDGEG